MSLKLGNKDKTTQVKVELVVQSKEHRESYGTAFTNYREIKRDRCINKGTKSSCHENKTFLSSSQFELSAVDSRQVMELAIS